MEESDKPSETLYPSPQTKHAAMLERLSNLHQTRLQQHSLSRNSKNADSFESAHSFLTRFSDSKNSIDSELTRCRQTTIPESNPNLKSDLEKVSISISDLEKVVAESSYFLPSYEVRSCLNTISDLKQTLEIVSSEVVPKKRFAFKNKQTKKSATRLLNESETKSEIVPSERTNFRVWDSPGFRDKENEVLTKEFKEGSEIGEFTISDLSDCQVRLKGCLRALFVHRLKNCRVYVGAVFGSVLIEEVEGCVFVLASHQIRIHHAKVSDFYLRVRSRPIIEDSNGVRFAPYCLSYDGIEKDLEESNLDVETGNWVNVDDFRWLRAVQSPNWSVLPQNERVGTVNISNSET